MTVGDLVDDDDEDDDEGNKDDDEEEDDDDDDEVEADEDEVDEDTEADENDAEEEKDDADDPVDEKNEEENDNEEEIDEGNDVLSFPVVATIADLFVRPCVACSSPPMVCTIRFMTNLVVRIHTSRVKSAVFRLFSARTWSSERLGRAVAPSCR